MKLKLLNITFIFLLLSSCNTGGVKRQSTNTPKKNKNAKCDTFDIFVSNLIKAKVEYEKAVFNSDILHLESKKKRYYSMITHYKLNRDQSINCINQRLKKKELINSNFIQFCYFPPYESSIPKCGYISYGLCLLLLKYNLSMPNGSKELVCTDSILNLIE